MNSIGQRFVTILVVAVAAACGGGEDNPAIDAGGGDAAPVDAAVPIDGEMGCEPGYQDEDGDGTCKLGCAGTGANDGLNCGAGGVCEIDDAGDRGCVCNDGYEGTFCDTCSLGYERVGNDCLLNLPPTTNLSLWLDADSAASLTIANNLVASWADRRGGGAAVSLGQTVPAARPAFQAMGQAGRGALVFDGDDQLSVNAYGGLSGADYEIIVAMNPLGGGAKGIVSLASGTTAWAVMLEQPAGGGDYRVTHRNPAGATGGVTATADRTNNVQAGWVVATHQSSGAIDTVAIFASDGTTAATNVADATPSSGIGNALTLRVGRSEGGFMAGQVFEVLVYTQRLTVAQRKEVTDYLTAKWNLP